VILIPWSIYLTTDMHGFGTLDWMKLDLFKEV